MNQRLSNKGLWVLFAVLLGIAISSFNYKPPCIPAFDSPSYTDSDGIIIVDATGCQSTIPGINDRMLLLAKVISALLCIAAISILVRIFRRMKLNKFYSKNAAPVLSNDSENAAIVFIKYWIMPVLIAIVFIGLLILGMYVLWRMGLLHSNRY